MSRRRLLPSFLLVLGLMPALAFSAERLPAPAQWMPQDVVAVVEVSNPKPILDLVASEKMIAAVTSLPNYQQVSEDPKFRMFLGVVKYLELQLGTDWRTGLDRLAGGGIALAITPQGGTLLIVDAKDEAALAKLHEIIEGFVKGEAAKTGGKLHSSEYNGVAIRSFGPEDYHVILGRRLMLSNREDVLKAALDRREKEGESAAALPAYKAAKKAAGPTAAATAFVNLALIKQNPDVRRGLAGDQNPMGVLLLGGMLDSLRQSNWLAAGLRVEGNRIALDLVTDAVGDSSSPAVAFSTPKPGDGALPNLAVPRRLAAMTFYRDLHAFYSAKDKLFPERTSGLIFFENMMGIFFSGRDLTEEVLAELKPEVRFVVAQQEYDPKIGTPQVQVPAFAAVFQLRNPEKFNEIAIEAWQKAIGLVSFTSGQKGRPGLVIDKDIYDGVKVSVAFFSTSGLDKKEPLPVQYNFRPALAMVGDSLIFSSTDGLARDLIDAIKKKPAKPVADTHTAVDLDLAQIGELLALNRDAMVRQNMVEKGNSRKKAEGEIDLLLSAFKLLSKARLTSGSSNGQSRTTLQFALDVK